jgi:hypothetical protein
MKNRFSNRETLNSQVSGPSGANPPNIVATSHNARPATNGSPAKEVRNAELPGIAGIRSIGDVIVGIGPMSPSVETIRAAGEFAQASA